MNDEIFKERQTWRLIERAAHNERFELERALYRYMINGDDRQRVQDDIKRLTGIIIHAQAIMDQIDKGTDEVHD